MLKNLRNRIRGHIPYTNWWLVWGLLNKTPGNTILDLGCGTGTPMLFLNRDNRFHTTGVDGWEPSIEVCRRERSHDTLQCQDLRNLHFASRSFDLVLCLQTLEHLDRFDGQKLLQDMRCVARKQVIVTTDVGDFTQGVSADGNSYQVHRHIWKVAELEGFGFRVYGTGVRGWGGEDGYGAKLKGLGWLLGTGMQVLSGPWMSRHPERADAVVCVLNKEEEH